MSESTDEITAGRRFAFGENWSRFLAQIDGFELEHLKTSGCSIACNEYVFLRKNRAPETTDTGR